MLSSMVQQVSPPELSVCVAYVSKTGDPNTDQVLDVFEGQGLTIRRLSYVSEDSIQYRGLVRNEQLKNCSADWIIFADGDLVYPPTFFKDLADTLQIKYADNPRCMFLQRTSCELEDIQPIIDDMTYPCIVHDVWNRCDKIPKRTCANIGAGYCQIANVHLLRQNHGGLYQPDGLKIDRALRVRCMTSSDQYFKKKLGRCPIKDMPGPLQFHLQHERGNYSKQK